MFSEQTWLARIIWGALLVVALWALVEWQLELAFVALATLALSVAPLFVARWIDIRVPPSVRATVLPRHRLRWPFSPFVLP